MSLRDLRQAVQPERRQVKEQSGVLLDGLAAAVARAGELVQLVMLPRVTCTVDSVPLRDRRAGTRSPGL